MSNAMNVILYTDGASRGNPGPGGYGSVLLYQDTQGVTHRLELSCGFERTTNNRMEILGVIAGFEALRYPCSVTVYSDSQYVVNAFEKHWIDSWQANNWRTSSRSPVKNEDLWKRLLDAIEGHAVHFEWVKGHAGNKENERCDELATSAADSPERLIDEGFEASLND